MQADLEEWLESAKASLGEASRLLTDPVPESLERCRGLFESLHAGLRLAAGSAGGSDPQVRDRRRLGLLELQKLLFRSRRLLEHAAGFYTGWAHIRNTLTSGYTAQGQPASARPTSRLSLEA
jgi:hypothetical protein